MLRSQRWRCPLRCSWRAVRRRLWRTRIQHPITSSQHCRRHDFALVQRLDEHTGDIEQRRSHSDANLGEPMAADLTPDQIAQAQAAIAAYVGYSELVDRAYADPGKDWSAEAASGLRIPVKSSLLQNLAGTAALGQYTTGAIELSIRP